MNIRIIRVFTRIREMLIDQKEILIKLERIEQNIGYQKGRLESHAKELKILFTALRELLSQKEVVHDGRPIGFQPTHHPG